MHSVLTACGRNHSATGSLYDNERGGLDGSGLVFYVMDSLPKCG